MLQHLNKYSIILGSASPRRKELLTDLGLQFKTKTTNKEEHFPEQIKENEIAEFLAQQKSNFLAQDLKKGELLITADTIVSFNKEVLNKPKNTTAAFNTLKKLSGNTHKVITGVCIKTLTKELSFSSTTKVSFKELSNTEIHYYIKNHNPFDKAGAYGIQDWIGKIAIINIEGSYTNVVGLPTADLYQKLQQFI